MRITPAEWVIKSFGGVRATARALRRSPGSVRGWQNSKERKGSEGKIPSALQAIILRLAEERGLDITPEDLIRGRKLVEA